MTDLVNTPDSTTDPYAPETANTAPVRLRCTTRSGTTITLVSDRRVLGSSSTTTNPPLRLAGCLYLFRGVDATGVRLYHEVDPIALDAEPTTREQFAHANGVAQGRADAFGAIDSILQQADTFYRDPAFPHRGRAHPADAIHDKVFREIERWQKARTR